MANYLSQIDLNNNPTNYAGSANLVPTQNNSSGNMVIYGPAYPGPVYGPEYPGPIYGPTYFGPQTPQGYNSPQTNGQSQQTQQQSTQPSNSSGAKAGAGYVEINPDWFKLPSQQQQDAWLKSAYEKLKPYYEKLLNEAKGDLTEAQRRLDYDYETGNRYAQEDFSILTGRAEEDSVASLKALGLDITQENEQLQDTQNKRGIALEQNTNQQVGVAQPGQVTYDQYGNPTVLGVGRAGYERSMVREDQALRKEAINRTKTRALKDAGINLNRKQEDLTESKGRGTYDTQAGYRESYNKMTQEQDTRATSMAESAFNREMQQKSLDLQKASLDAQNKALQQG